MGELVHCTQWLSPFDPTQKRSWAAPWGPDATIANLAPATFRDLEDVMVLRNGERVPREEWGNVLAPGDYVEWSLDPGLFGVAAAGTLLSGGVTTASSL